MRIGVNLLNFGPGVSPDSLAGWTQLVETLGYHFVMISDLLDTYTDDAEATRHHETAWRMLALLAERALDLPRETLR